jgi:hypothetical protein
MADKFTGFWEERRPDETPILVTTVGDVPVDELLERLRVRLLEAPPGTHIRVDLISWGEI